MKTLSICIVLILLSCSDGKRDELIKENARLENIEDYQRWKNGWLLGENATLTCLLLKGDEIQKCIDEKFKLDSARHVAMNYEGLTPDTLHSEVIMGKAKDYTLLLPDTAKVIYDNPEIGVGREQKEGFIYTSRSIR